MDLIKVIGGSMIVTMLLRALETDDCIMHSIFKWFVTERNYVHY